MHFLPAPELLPGENLIHTARASWWAQFTRMALGIGLLPLAGLGVLFLFRAWWDVQSDVIWVTSRRLIRQQGIIRRRLVDVSVQRVGMISIEQGLLGRLCGYGDVCVASGPVGLLQFPCMADPLSLRNSIHRIQHRHGVLGD